MWVAPLDTAPSVLEALVASLSPTERARAGRYRFAHDARRFSAARGWLRHVLALQIDIDPHAVRFSDGPGKPRLLQGTEPSLSFSVSRSAELALIAVANLPIGVDMEHSGDRQKRTDAAKLACTPTEKAALAWLPRDERARAFLCSWTAKEAFVKGTGQGLAVAAPSRIHVGTLWADAPVPVVVDKEPCPPNGVAPAGEERRPSGWWIRHLRPAPDYVAALATESKHWAITMRSTAELEVAAAGACRP